MGSRGSKKTLAGHAALAQLPLFQDHQPTSCVSPERLPTNTTTYKHPVHRWFNFIAGFSPEFVHQCCEAARLGHQAVLLDPFAGCGTALVVAAERGMRSIGYEPHPVFARIARAKLPSPHSLDELAEVEQAISRGLLAEAVSCELSPDAELFLAKLFSQEHLRDLLGARQELEVTGLSRSDLGFLALSAVVEKVTHSQTDGIYKAPTSRKTVTSPDEATRAVVSMIAHDLTVLDQPDYASLGRVHPVSSEHMSSVPNGGTDIIVTSPPYLNNFDYAEMTRMLLYFWNIAGSWGDITEKVRKKLIVNTTSALKGHKDRQHRHRETLPFKAREELDGLVEALRARRQMRAGKKQYDYLVYPYFSQMTQVLKECLRCLKPGAPIHVMVADAALYGVHIPTPQLLTVCGLAIYAAAKRA